MQGTTLELKYCERCGGLGVRRSGSSENYCEACARLLTRQFSSLRRRGRGARPSLEPEMRRTLRLCQEGLCVSATGVLS